MLTHAYVRKHIATGHRSDSGDPRIFFHLTEIVTIVHATTIDLQVNYDAEITGIASTAIRKVNVRLMHKNYNSQANCLPYLHLQSLHYFFMSYDQLRKPGPAKDPYQTHIN